MNKKPYFLRTRSTESPWVQCEGLSKIAITINPDPNHNNYESLAPEEQREYIKIATYLALEKCKGVKLDYLYFELTKAGNIHAHGCVSVAPLYNPTYKAIQFGKHVARQIGRKRVPWYVSCWCDSNDDMKKWLEYCSKDGQSAWTGLTPKTLSRSVCILDFIYSL